ncbi:MAG: dihydrofolate reductase [Muribaculaceae bacterium]|nr:dihydrofolate reductase [Muribaculaceae bacterium]
MNSNDQSRRRLAAVVVVAEDGGIGRDGDLLCHLPADLKHFKQLTMGHSIVMGRRTFDSFPKGALPGRQNIVVTRNRRFTAPGVTVVHDIDAAIAAAEMPGDVIIIGGAQIYAATLHRVSTLHLTRLHATFPDADAHFPAIDPDQWETVSEEPHPADERNPYAYTFVTLRRRCHDGQTMPQAGKKT